MQWLYRVIGQMGIFLICAQTIVHFRPKESYDKYLKLLLSVMLLLQLLQPVLNVLGDEGSFDAQTQAEEFTEGLQAVLDQASWQTQQTEKQIGAAADSVNGKTQEECGQRDAGQTEVDRIHVEVGSVELE